MAKVSTSLNRSAAWSVTEVTHSETLANLWQAALNGSPADALCLVELRGFEPLTPCMPLTSPPLAIPHLSTRSPISALLSR